MKMEEDPLVFCVHTNIHTDTVLYPYTCYVPGTGLITEYIVLNHKFEIFLKFSSEHIK